MLPVTHAYYLASGLWLLGLAGLLVRRDAGGRLVALALMLAGAAVLLAAFARAWAQVDGQVLAALAAVVAGAYAIALASLVRGRGGA